ncbi:efflux transporter periplasmic adaptor subunit [Rhodospirillum rubrum]|uniref:efflux RND transporter periplasmic adaptor subunit n=1 Tax=Rhodospirillum rubrum TaxID=1085 RepID=UPI00190645C4|nr:efflux RND transporter periplasmic adaptor subunit [Rhodospirillum rubrum]MBK1663503.1 efflux transporter periplasmic adaptor subunit [Rhodospirillum rubrum]MBK1675701.1 efflux transporter periplasmic adaptor subunit [Rhodospirillum rubrum]
MKKKRLAIMLVGSIVLFGGVIGFTVFRDHMIAQYFANQPEPVITVTVEDARAEDWQDTIPAVGTLRAINGVTVGAAVAGIVETISFESGQRVKKGDLLVRLDDGEERGELDAVRAQAELSRITASRARRLVQSAAGTRATLDDAEAQLRVNLATIGQLEARVAKKTVTAPFDGVLGVRAVDLGEYVTAGQTLVDLQDLSVILADFSVSQKDLGRVAVGAKLTLTTDAWPGRLFEGAIKAIAPKVDANTGMAVVEGRFDNPDGALRPGMFAKLAVLRAEHQSVVTVPATAVTYSLHGDALYVLKEAGEDGKVRVDRITVTTGVRRGDRVVVTAGLSAGQRVVTSGQVKLNDGSAVTVADTPLNTAARAEGQSTKDTLR